MLQDIVLGLVQGLTEFLPVSSSGHLQIVPAAMGWDDPSLTFDVLLHLGTLASVLIYFRHELAGLVAGLFGRGPDPGRSRRTVGYLAVGTIPAAVLGLAFGGFFERVFESPYVACFNLLVTAGILLAVEWLGQRVRHRQIDAKVALGVGMAQGLAIFPGISRSGSTIGAGLGMGLSREEATRFSFLLSIPAIAGAGVVSAGDVAGGELEITASVVAGVVAAGISGYLAIGGLLRFVRTRSLRVFSLYLVVAAPVSALIIAIRR